MRRFHRAVWTFLAALLMAVAAVVVWTEIPWSLGDILSWLQHAPPLYVVTAMMVAPLFGVPLSPLLASLAIVLPFWSAWWIVVLSIFLHHLLVLLLIRSSFADSLRIKMREKRLLPAERASRHLTESLLFIFTTTWLPGVSYIFKPAYLLLAGVSTKHFLVFGTSSQMLAALPYLLLGQAAGSGHFFWFSVVLFSVFALAWVLKSYARTRGVSMGGGREK